jgi:hypothetical protein
LPEAHAAPVRPVARPGRGIASGRLIALLTAVLLIVTMALPSWMQATGDAKVVVIVGPVGSHSADYKDQAREVIAEARKYTSNVVVLFTPRATWSRVSQAATGASVLVYFGHGWGYPSRYGPFDGTRMNGMALDPPSGANGTRRIYYGENRVRTSIRMAPGAAVLLYRLCYASGNTEPALSEGTTAQSKRRVDGFGAGFLGTGAGVVIADGHPKSAANYMRQLFTTDRSVWSMFTLAPNHHHHVLGPYTSARTPGARYAMDPDRGGSSPSGFYRSIVGNLALRTTEITGRVPVPTPSPSESGSPGFSESPSDSASPGDSGSPGATAEPTASPTPEATPEPTADASVSPPPAPSVEPSATPDPPADPSPTPDPTVGPEPSPSSSGEVSPGP